MNRMNRVRSVWRVALGIALVAAWLGSTKEVEAQTCSPNMLSVGGPTSYVATPDANSLHLASGFTIECWAKLSSYYRFAAIFDKASNATTFYGMFLDTAQHVFGRISDHAQVRVYSPQLVLSDWHHFAMVFAPSDSLYLYIDGAEAAAVKVSASTLDWSADSLRVGASGAGTSFIGSIDDFRIWDIPRTQGAIDSTMYQSLTGNESHLVLYYPFDDEIGSMRIHDFSDHGNDGFIRGASAEIVGATSPVTTPTPGFRLNAKESSLIISTKRCAPAFDTVVHIRNLGSEPLIVNAVGLHPGLAFSVSSTLPFQLPADSTRFFPLRIHFAPPAGGTYTDTLYLSSSDICAGTVRIGLQGTYDSVGLDISPTTVDFGFQTQCQLPLLRAVTVRNTSVTDSETIVGSNLPAGIAVVTPLPLTLAKGESRVILLRLDPGTAGSLVANLGLDLDKCSREAVINVMAFRQIARLGLPQTVSFPPTQSTLGGITHDTTIVLANTGNMPMLVTNVVATPDTMLQLLERRQGLYLSAGDTIQLHLRMHASQCGHFSAKLSARGFACSVDTTIAVTMDVNAPQPLSTSPLDVGRVCILKDTLLTLTNPNDQVIRLDTLTFSRNAVFFTPDTTFPQMVAPHGSITIPIRFAPALNGDFAVTGFAHMSPCGVTVIDLRGSKGAVGLAFAEKTLSFGRGCDSNVVTKNILLQNGSTRPVTLSAATITGSTRFTLGSPSLPITLAAGASENVSITYTPTLGKKENALLSFLSSEGCPLVELPLSGSRENPKASWSIAQADFDTVCSGEIALREIGLKNNGIDTLDIFTTSISGNGFGLMQHPVAIGPGDIGTFSISLTGSGQQGYAGSLTVLVNACGASFTIPLVGVGGPAPLVLLSDSVHEFGQRLVGDSDVYCITLRNPSCSGLQVDPSTITITDPAFHLAASSATALPFTLKRDTALTLCFVYRPTTYGANAAHIPLTIAGTSYGTISLKGEGLAPDVRVAESVIDFGSIVRGTSRTLPLHITNVGNYPATLSITNTGSPDYSNSGPTTLAAGASSVDQVTFLPQPTTGLLYATLILQWDGDHHDTVTLRGEGVDCGMLVSNVGLDFGAVHVQHDSTREFDITALGCFPTVQQPVITSDPNGAYSITSSASYPYTIKDATDTLRVFVTYRAAREAPDSAALNLRDGVRVTSVPLSGHGVEAHVRVNPVAIDFGDVDLGSSHSQPVTLRDIGGYQLSVSGVSIGLPFTVAPILPKDPISAGDSIQYALTFAPQRARVALDTLRFQTTSPDVPSALVVRGRGVYPAGERPSFGYSVASVTVKAGDHVLIPVSINGTQLNHLDIDSVVLDLRYDPTMVAMNGALVEPTGIQVSRRTQLDDSTIEIAFPITTVSAGVLVSLEAEALLGSHETTYVRVINADPAADQSSLANDGAFVVSDCGGALHGVSFSGDYNVKSITPNPANDNATLHYTLGIAGDVTVEIYNAVGKLVHHEVMPDESQGDHVLRLDASSLPNGRYVYRVRSLDWTGEGSLIVMH